MLPMDLTLLRGILTEEITYFAPLWTGAEQTTGTGAGAVCSQAHSTMIIGNITPRFRSKLNSGIRRAQWQKKQRLISPSIGNLPRMWISPHKKETQMAAALSSGSRAC